MMPSRVPWFLIETSEILARSSLIELTVSLATLVLDRSVCRAVEVLRWLGGQASASYLRSHALNSLPFRMRPNKKLCIPLSLPNSGPGPRKVTRNPGNRFMSQMGTRSKDGGEVKLMPTAHLHHAMNSSYCALYDWLRWQLAVNVSKDARNAFEDVSLCVQPSATHILSRLCAIVVVKVRPHTIKVTSDLARVKKVG